jgi:hypothetical protein
MVITLIIMCVQLTAVTFYGVEMMSASVGFDSSFPGHPAHVLIGLKASKICDSKCITIVPYSKVPGIGLSDVELTEI